MTFAILRGDHAPAVRSGVAAAGLFATHTHNAAIDLVRVFGLDRLPVRPQLACCWHRDSDGRLTCLWKPDIVVIPQR